MLLSQKLGLLFSPLVVIERGQCEFAEPVRVRASPMGGRACEVGFRSAHQEVMQRRPADGTSGLPRAQLMMSAIEGTIAEAKVTQLALVDPLLTKCLC